jgi:isopentenyl-diphosphate delta-isomerase
MIDQAGTTERRKGEHLKINLECDVQARATTTGLERYRFIHNALPEGRFEDVDIGTTFLGHFLSAPILISSMTGGVKAGWEINRRLATAARELGCAMGVGSQRIALDDPGAARFFEVRDVAPNIPLFANLGAVQLNYGYGPDQCRRAIEMICADALILHLNPLQEVVQPEGNRNFSGLLRRIEAVCSSVGVPVIVKEVGCGISEDAARRLVSAGVSAIDVGGAGGTSWSAVEHHRARSARGRRVSEAFIDWGIPTAESIVMARRGAPEHPLIASGGLRNGLDAAKAIALGADLAGFAGPLLKAAALGETEIVDCLASIIDELRIALFCSGARTLTHLKDAALTNAGDGSWLIQPDVRQTKGVRHAA